MKEDINNLEEIINLCKEEINNNDKNITATLDLEDLKSLENLLTRYKQLEEENTEWRAKWIVEMARVEDKEKEILHWKGQYHLLSRKINVIPKSLVKEKIEEVRGLKFKDERLDRATIDFAVNKFEDLLGKE